MSAMHFAFFVKFSGFLKKVEIQVLKIRNFFVLFRSQIRCTACFGCLLNPVVLQKPVVRVPNFSGFEWFVTQKIEKQTIQKFYTSKCDEHSIWNDWMIEIWLQYLKSWSKFPEKTRTPSLQPSLSYFRLLFRNSWTSKIVSFRNSNGSQITVTRTRFFESWFCLALYLPG